VYVLINLSSRTRAVNSTWLRQTAAQARLREQQRFALPDFVRPLRGEVLRTLSLPRGLLRSTALTRSISQLHQGHRVDLDGARETALSDGMRTVSLTLKYQAIRVAMICLSFNELGRDSDIPVHVIWCYGPSGSGKTRWIYDYIAENGLDAYWAMSGARWFDGYDAHNTLVLDDYRMENYPLHFFLRLLDRYPMRVEIKGGTRQMRATTILLSSIMHPRHVYNVPNEPTIQILRRITLIKQFPEVPEVPVPEVEEGNNMPLPLWQPPPLVRVQAQEWPTLDNSEPAQMQDSQGTIDWTWSGVN